MKNNYLKKLLAITAAAIVLSVPTVFAQDILREEIVDLYNLGIITDAPDETFRPGDLITRGEFAGWLAGADNIDRKPYTGTFTDVTAENPNADSIDSLAAAGIMVGFGDGTFLPDNPILVEEALKSVLKLMGYSRYADAAGGYPEGYLKVGYDKELLEGITGSSGGQMTREDAAVLLYNAMFTDIMVPEGIDGNGIIYGEKEGETLLYHTRKIKQATGIVTANSVTDLDGGNGIADDTLRIGEIIYKDMTDNGQSLIGRKTEFYYVDNDQGEIVYIKAARRTSTVLLNSDDIDDYSGNVLKYYNGSKRENYDISSMADVIYNGKVLDYSKNDITFTGENGVQEYYGTIELVDNDGDDEYDVMNISAYHNVIISSVRNLDNSVDKENSGRFEIIDKNGITISINPEKNYTLKDADNNDIKWTELAENDVLAAAISKDGKNIELIRCTNVVTGEVTSISNDGIRYSVVINGEEYEIQQSLGFYCVDQTNASIGLTAGDKAFFTLDIAGRIALVKDKSINAGPAYGLIINYLISDSQEDILIKLMRASGDIELVPAAQKVTIDGASYKGIDSIKKKLTDISKLINGADNGGNALRKEILVKYEMNTDGEIIRIDTPYLNTPESSEDKQTLHIMKLQKEVAGEQAATDPVKLIFRNNTFGGRIVVDSSTLFFYVPPVSGVSDASTYAIIPLGQLKIDEDHEIRAYVSNTQKQIPEAVVIYSNPVYSKNVSEINKGTDIGIYLGSHIGMDQDGNARECMTIFHNGGEITKCVESADVENYSSLVPGDVIRFGTNGNANVDTIHVVYKLDQNKLFREGLDNAATKNGNLLFTNGGARAIFGGVYSRENNIIAVVNQVKKYQENDTSKIDDGGLLVNDNMGDLSLQAQSSIERYDISQYKIYRFNSDTETMETVTASDILAYQQTQSEYDYALIFTIDYRPGTVILYSKDDVEWNY